MRIPIHRTSPPSNLFATDPVKPTPRSILLVIRTIVLAAIAGLLVTTSFAQETSNVTTSESREEAQQRRAKLPFAKGTIDSIDLLRHQLKLKTKGDLRTFTYTARTYIFRGKEKITPEGLRTGELIALRFYTDQDGQVLVSRIKAYGTNQVAGAESPGPAEPAK